MNEDTITVYTRTTCVYCVQVKKLLDMKGKAYNTINIDDDKDAEKHIVEKSGARTVPVVTVVKNGEEQVASIGWNPGALMRAIA